MSRIRVSVVPVGEPNADGDHPAYRVMCTEHGISPREYERRVVAALAASAHSESQHNGKGRL